MAKDIEFDQYKGKLLTKCPHGELDDGSYLIEFQDVVMVGSCLCRECPSHISYDHNSQKVKCDR